MMATVPRGAGSFCRILVELIQVRCLGMTGKREAPVNKVRQSQVWCFNHSEMVLIPCWSFLPRLLLFFSRRDSNLVKEEIKTFLNNRRISQAIVGQVTGTPQFLHTSKHPRQMSVVGSDLSCRNKDRIGF